MSITTDYSYIGKGQIYLRELGAGSKGLIQVGNASALSFAVTEDVKELMDYTTAGGGLRNEKRRVESVEATMTLHDLSPENLSLALYGSTSAIASAAVTTETHAAYPGALVAFAFMPAASPDPVITGGPGATSAATTTAYTLGAMVVPATPNGYFYAATTAGTSAGSAPTWPTTIGDTVTDGTVVWTCMGKTALVKGTDYEIRSGGVLILPGASLAPGAVVNAAYTKAAVDLVQAITQTGKEYEMLFDGLNEARSGKRVRIRVWRQKVGAAQELSLIGDEYAALELTGKLLKDSSITSAGLSQYFTVEVEQ
jgi:hypothetical protein